MTVTDERLDQIARNLLAYEIANACTDPQYQKGALYGALDGYDRMDGIERDELVARFDAALGRAKAELIQEGN